MRVGALAILLSGLTITNGAACHLSLAQQDKISQPQTLAIDCEFGQSCAETIALPAGDYPSQIRLILDLDQELVRLRAVDLFGDGKAWITLDRDKRPDMEREPEYVELGKATDCKFRGVIRLDEMFPYPPGKSPEENRDLVARQRPHRFLGSFMIVLTK